MRLGLTIVIFTCLANAMLGAFVYLRNSKSKSNVAFLAMSLFITTWSIVDYLTNLHIAVSLNNFFDRLAYIFAYLAVLSGWRFSYYFGTSKKKYKGVEKKIILSLAVVMVCLSITHYVAGTAKYVNGHLVFSVGGLIVAYILGLLAMLSLITRNLVSAMQQGNRQEKDQARLILFGFSATVLLGIVSNVIIPSISSTWQSTTFGPVISLVLVGCVTYAIVRHRLFDIRLLVARSLAYILSITTLGVVFILLALFITNTLCNLTNLNSIRAVYTLLAISMALTLTRLKDFFDKRTNRIFFRDAYDTQSFLDQFNKVLVSNFELHHLLAKGAQIIVDNLKPTYCSFIINARNGLPERVIENSSRLTLSKEDLSKLRDQARISNSKIIITDTLDDDESSMASLFSRHNIAVLAPLTYSKQGGIVGYLVLGPKKSGNLYSPQDSRVIEIIANELVIAIVNALRFEEIENFNITLQSKVDEATRNLRRTNEKLKQIDETKDDFISMASHQLRTPLTSVKGYISMLLEEDAGKITQTQREMLGQAFFSSQRMVYLIADLLNVSRLKSGKFIITPTAVNLATMVQQELQQLKEIAAARSLTLEYEKPADFPDLMFDETKIRQVIMNFVDNSIYYTPAGGTVTVRLINNPETIELHVEDNGIGVPKSEQPHLFTKFYRAGNARKARPDGTGLGLFMAKKVIIAQGGSTLFTSQEGKGSTFGFIFSKTKLAVNASAAKPLKPVPESTSL